VWHDSLHTYVWHDSLLRVLCWRIILRCTCDMNHYTYTYDSTRHAVCSTDRLSWGPRVIWLFALIRVTRLITQGAPPMGHPEVHVWHDSLHLHVWHDSLLRVLCRRIILRSTMEYAALQRIRAVTATWRRAPLMHRKLQGSDRWVYICVFVCTYMHVYIHTRMHVCVYVYMCHLYVHLYVGCC